MGEKENFVKALFMDDIKSTIFSCLKLWLRDCGTSMEEAFSLAAAEKHSHQR